MKILIDTNLVIAAESPRAQHPDSTKVLSLLAVAVEDGHEIFVHPGTMRDLARDKNADRRKTSEAQLGKYKSLAAIPFLQEWAIAAGYELPVSENDEVDITMLMAVDRKAVDLFVTQDAKLRRSSVTMNLFDQVMSVDEAHEFLSSLRQDKVYLPSVEETVVYAIDPKDPFFDSLRADYDDFDDWIAKASAEHRICFVMKAPDGSLDGVLIVKPESDNPHNLGTHVLKLCLMKVAGGGRRLGELLLKAVFDFPASKQCEWMYVEVYAKHAGLVALLENFGFSEISRSSKGELVLAKPRSANVVDVSGMSSLEFHKTLGPPAVRVEQGFVIPIRPHWHDILFPELCVAPDLFGPRPSGNALTKAYLSRSTTTLMRRGDLVLFYRSVQQQGITVAGVVDETLRSADPDEIFQFVGNRTVYTRSEVEQLCEGGSVLAVLFRRDRVIQPAWPLRTLNEANAVAGVPQSVTKIREGSIEWLQQKLDALP